MAISVDRVYQTVLALANKEQRGYITPQEFNLFANHAQNSIFEQYFYDLNQFYRIPSNNSVISDPRDITEEKVSVFKEMWGGELVDFPDVEDLHKVESVWAEDKDKRIALAEELSSLEEYYVRNSLKLTKPSVKRPVYILAGGDIFVYPVPYKAQVSYIRTPKNPNWTYAIVNNQALWNPGAEDKQDFELHPSEEKNLVTKILQLAGVAIKDYNMVQVAAQEELKSIQQEKS